MGVVNVTPDSFSDGGRFQGEAAAVSHALMLVEQGADVLDVGGESTRPGALPVAADHEIARVIPVIGAIRQALSPRSAGAIVTVHGSSSSPPSPSLSVDTMKPAVARAAIAAGADIWNDVTALRGAPDSLDVAAELGCRVVLMHMRGEPRTMQESPAYDDVVGEVEAFLLARAEAAIAAGVARERVLIDPGIGFGKRPEHSFALLAALPRLVAHGWPVLLGASRKRFIAAADPTATDAGDRLGGSLAAALRGAQAGVAMVRVHDVRETAQALAVWSAAAG
jgi:dihydropteroate synthase